MLGSVCTAQISLISGAAAVYEIIQKKATLVAEFGSSVDSMDAESEDEDEKELIQVWRVIERMFLSTRFTDLRHDFLANLLNPLVILDRNS